jgi:hypothetical protein
MDLCQLKVVCTTSAPRWTQARGMEKLENEIKDEKEVSGMVVAVRIKPMEEHEHVLSIQSLGQNLIKILSSEPKTYHFDYVHWSTGTSIDYPNYVSQEMVFESIGQPIVQNSSLGYNCSLFAYGQTVISFITLVCFLCSSNLLIGFRQNLYNVRRAT